MAIKETPQIEILPSADKVAAIKPDELINDFFDSVAINPAAAALVLRAASAVIANEEAYREIDFGEAAEKEAEEKLKPVEKLRNTDSDQQRGRIIGSNILGRAAVYAERLDQTAQLEQAAKPSIDLPQSA